MCCLTRNRSYSLTDRRKNSSSRTRQMTPMQEPANMPGEVMCHEEERKQASMVYQFQSMLILQESPMPLMSPMLELADEVVAAAGMAIVPVELLAMLMLMLIFIGSFG